ncbi:MAG: hypothetical protein U9R16_02620 [Campylobacterota bacterium]|nr:hypothetical protein [Campylobacterota bacterium]
MKAVKLLVGFILLNIIAIYIILFTPVNQSVLVPIIEENITKSSKVTDVKVNKFELSLSGLNIVILLDNQEVKVNSSFDIFSQDLDLTYNVNFTDISIFNKISGQKLQGTFSTQGTLKGKFNNLDLKGKALIASGDINYSLNINDDINNINAIIKNMKIDKLLYTVSQPAYAKADLNIDLKIKSLNNLNGNIITTLSNGMLNNNIIKKDFNITLPSKPTFKLDALTTLDKNIISTKTNIKTFVANIDTKATIFDTKTSTLNSDYIVTIPNLSKLYFVTNQKMKGDIKINGDVVFKDTLTATFNSNKFNGKIAGKLEKDDLKVSIKDINSLKILDMIYYPMVFNSTVDLNLDYNIKSKKGKSNLTMKDGKFLPNQLSDTIKKFIQKDLTTEIYKTTVIKTDINNQKLNSTLFMESKNSKITSDKIFIDLEKSKIDSDIDLTYFKYAVGIKLTEQLTNPKVKIDTNKLVKSKAKEKVKEALDKKLGDKLDDDTKKAIGGFLDKLF